MLAHRHHDRAMTLSVADPSHWLWCLQCERFFQACDARRDSCGDACPFDDCPGVGYGVDLFDWDAWPGGDPELEVHWPARSELRKGLHACGATFARAGSAGGDGGGDGPGAGGGSGWFDARAPGFVRNRDAGQLATMLGAVAPDRASPRAHGRVAYGFIDADLAALAALVQAGFVASWDRAGRGPSVAECLLLCARFPELRASGYVLSARPLAGDAADVVLTGLGCDTRAMSLERRAALGVALAVACFDEGTLEEREGYLGVDWSGAAGPH